MYFKYTLPKFEIASEYFLHLSAIKDRCGTLHRGFFNQNSYLLYTIIYNLAIRSRLCPLELLFIILYRLK